MITTCRPILISNYGRAREILQRAKEMRSNRANDNLIAERKFGKTHKHSRLTGYTLSG